MVRENKHPHPAPIADSSLLYGPIDFIPKYYFESINEESVLKAALMTKGSAGPSGMDADIYLWSGITKVIPARGSVMFNVLWCFDDMSLIAQFVSYKKYPISSVYSNSHSDSGLPRCKCSMFNSTKSTRTTFIYNRFK